MIGRLRGQLALKARDHVMIDVGGVGYVVTVSERTLAALPPQGSVVSLFTDLLVREDLLQLFGFLSVEEKEWHRLLMSVQGIGAKASMAILGTLGADGVTQAIALGDWASVKAAPGVGPKIAQRVVNELKDKAPDVMTIVAPQAENMDVLEPVDAPAGMPPAPAPKPEPGAQAEAMSALGNLGYAPAEAARAIAEARADGADTDTGTLIREALKRLAPGG